MLNKKEIEQMTKFLEKNGAFKPPFKMMNERGEEFESYLLDSTAFLLRDYVRNKEFYNNLLVVGKFPFGAGTLLNAFCNPNVLPQRPFTVIRPQDNHLSVEINSIFGLALLLTVLKYCNRYDVTTLWCDEAMQEIKRSAEIEVAKFTSEYQSTQEESASSIQNFTGHTI